ncbi:hypothetical protein Moror_5458, partial [Moniliophthora roreri MCA 2997]
MYRHVMDEFIEIPPDINTFPQRPLWNAESDCCQGFKKKLKKHIMNWANYYFKLRLIKKKTNIQRYQELHYENHIKDFSMYWERGTKDLFKEKNQLNECNNFSKKWLGGSPEFVEALQAKNAKIYAEEMTRYLKRGEWNGTAEDYSDAWKRAKPIITAVWDAIAIHFSIAVILFGIGPWDDRTIKTESVTSLVPCSQMLMMFQQFDCKKYRLIHQHCTKYASIIFSEEECKSQIVKADGTGDAESTRQLGWECFASSDDSSFMPAEMPIIRPELDASALASVPIP